MPEDDIELAVKNFIASFWSMRLSEIRMETRLEEDLGMTGDDAWEFMQGFSERFHVDMGAFVFQDYFGQEGCNPLLLFGMLLGFHAKPRQAITVSHLVDVAHSGKWTAP